MDLQVLLPFMATLGSSPAPEHTWNRQGQAPDQLLAPHLLVLLPGPLLPSPL